MISGTETSYVEEFHATATLSGYSPIGGAYGSVDIDFVPDHVSARWKRVDAKWRRTTFVITGYRVLKYGLSETQRGEWCPPEASIPPEFAAWLRTVTPDW